MIGEAVGALLVLMSSAVSACKAKMARILPPKEGMDMFASMYGEEVRSLTKQQLITLQVEAEINAEAERLAMCGELWKKLAADWSQMRVLMHDKNDIERFSVIKMVIDRKYEQKTRARRQIAGARYAYNKHYGVWPTEKELDIWPDTTRNVLRLKGPRGELVICHEAIDAAYEELMR